MPRKRPTVADILAMKGKRQLAMLRVETLEEAEAAERAGVDLLSLPPAVIEDRRFRDAAPGIFTCVGLDYGDYVTAEDYLRAAFGMLKASADSVYCAASMQIIRRMRDEGIPVCGHTGLVPSQSTWTGGFRAVGKDFDSAMAVWKRTKALEEAGCFAAEIEVVPAEVATAIAARTGMLMISMGAGAGCDAQYLFAVDVLGENRGHIPRHAKVYRNFAAELDRLQAERVAAFSEYVADVTGGAYPEPRHMVPIARNELARFLAALDKG
jgi:3-methyl-2-oxobutanoate hydroxymethyltransferase